MTVKLGLNIPNFGSAASPETLYGWVRFGEDTGFSIAMMSDHVAPTPDVAAIYPTPFYDTFTTLAWLAGRATSIELGTTVAVLPYRNPLLTARVAANIDQFSGGRFVLGVGVGWSKPEHDALGVSFADRGRITDEYLDVIRDHWAHDVISRTGDHVEFHEVHTLPAPVRSRHIPIWVGGNSAAAIRRTAVRGEAWHPINMNLDWLRDTGLPALRAEAERAGRPVPVLAPRIRARPTPEALPEEGRLSGVGSVDQIVADIHTLVELGSEYVVLDTNPDEPGIQNPKEDWEVLETLARRVLG
ncbi:MAG TPA: TIGR03619 family F420-dependent LLM class oxidoreductase [Actinopolymorphaceae bacterium]